VFGVFCGSSFSVHFYHMTCMFKLSCSDMGFVWL